MAKVERYICDRCGHTNNGLGADGWIALDPMPTAASLLVRPLARARGVPLFGDMNGPSPGPQQHFCGMECALGAISDYIRAVTSK